MLNYTGRTNAIYIGAPWYTILALVSSSPWTAADEDPDSWRLRIDFMRKGGTPAVLVNPAVIAIDPSDAKKLDMRFELTGQQTKKLYHPNPQPAEVELEHLYHGEWKPTLGMSGSADVQLLPGAGM